MQIIRKNFALKSISVLLAVLGWAYVRYAAGSNPTHGDQNITVPIVFSNLPNGYIATHVSQREASVTVRLKRDEAVPPAQAIRAVVDASNLSPGMHVTPVEVLAPNIAVQSLSPASISLNIERIEERTQPIVIHYIGSVPTGIAVGSASVEPASIDLRGPASALASIAAVRIDVPLQNTAKDLDMMIRPVAVDSLGAQIPDIQVAPNLVRVRIPFVKTKVIHQ